MEIKELEIELIKIDEDIKEKLKINLIGINVIHKKFGEGKIIEQEGNKIIVEFLDNNRKMFQIPLGFINGYLKCNNIEIMNKINDINELETKKEEIRNLIKIKENEIKEMEKIKEEKVNIVNTTMLAVTTGTSFDEDIRTNIYYCKSEKVRREIEYIGLYKDKAIKAIGKIKKVVEATRINGILKTELFYGEPISKEDEEKIEECIDKSIELFDCNIGARSHKYFIVEDFIFTDFEKESDGGLMGNKYFDLYDILNVEVLPSSEEIAKELKDKKWK